jgi:hypothetical protein
MMRWSNPHGTPNISTIPAGAPPPPQRLEPTTLTPILICSNPSGAEMGEWRYVLHSTWISKPPPPPTTQNQQIFDQTSSNPSGVKKGE